MIVGLQRRRLTLALGTLAITLIHTHYVPERIGFAEQPSAPVIIEAYSQNFCRRDRASSLHCRNILASPSLSLLRQYGGFLVEPPPAAVRSGQRGPAIVLAASHQSNLISQAMDKDPATRWSSGSGKQIGDEWILLRNPSPRVPVGVSIAVGNFSTDFPRGVRVSIPAPGLPCPIGSSSDRSQWEILFQSHSWQGAVAYTQEGYPYFTAQSQVEIPFHLPVAADCYLIEQTGRTEHFDWSVAEARFIYSRREPPSSPKQSEAEQLIALLR